MRTSRRFARAKRTRPRRAWWGSASRFVPLVLVSLFFVNSTSVAHAEARLLPLTSFREILVDHEHGHVFISGGEGSDSLVVTDLAGNDMRTIGPLPGAAGMALVGDLLYLARARGAAIDVVDATTLEIRGTIELPEATSGVLAYAAGRLWTHSACGQPSELISLDPATGLVVERPETFRCPLFETSALHPHLLFVGELGVSPTRQVFAYDASDWSPLAVRVFEFPEESGTLNDISAADHGRTILGAAFGDGEVPEYGIVDDQVSTVYQAVGRPSAVAQTSAGGGQVVVATSDSGKNVRVFREGSAEELGNYSVSFEGVQERGLALTPEAGAILAIVKEREPAELFLHDLPGPTADGSSVDLEVSDDEVGAGGSVTVTARVDAPAEASANLTIYAQPYGGDRVEISSEPVGGGGSVSKEVTVERNTTVFAHWAGTASVLPSTSTAREIGVPLIATCTLEGGYDRTGRYRAFRLGGAAPRITGGVHPALDAVPLGFVIERMSRKEWAPYAADSFETRADGTRTVRFVTKRPGSYRVRTVSLEETYESDASPWRYLRIVR